MTSTPTCSSGSPKPSRQYNQQFQDALYYPKRSLYGLEQRLVNVSDEDGSDDEPHRRLPVTTGNLNKWTNMLHGWQERYFVLKDGVLSYFRNADDVAGGCRGAIRLKNAQVQPHPYDDCRIDVSLGDSTWYFRCPSAQSRRHWVECIEKHRLAESGYSSEQALTTQSSLLSLNSITSASNLGGSGLLRGQSLFDGVAEIESLKTVLCQQAEKMLVYLETCHRIAVQAEEAGGYELLLESAVFDEILCQLRRELSTLHATPPYRISATLEKTPQPSFEEPNADTDDRDSLVSDTSSDELIYSSPLPGDATLMRKNNGHPIHATDSLPAVFFNTSPAAPRASSPKTNGVVSPDSGDEGTKTPKAGSSSRSCGSGGGGFFSRFLPFRGNANSTINAFANAAFPGAANSTVGNQSKSSTFSNKGKNRSEPSLRASRMHDLGILLNHFGALSIEFGTEVNLFRSTSSALQLALTRTMEVFNQREETWRRRLERETERRRTLERQLKIAQEAAAATRLNATLLTRRGIRMVPGKAHQRSHSHGGQLFPHLCMAPPTAITAAGAVSTSPVAGGKMFIVEEGGPDFAEGGSEYNVCEEHFYDAIDAQIDKMHQDEACLMALKSVGDKLRSADAMQPSHPLYTEVGKICEDRMGILRGGFPSSVGDVGSVNNGWTILAKQGDMTIYNREVESADGTYLDPLQAVHKVAKVTAREMCEAFWDVQYRLDWEITVDQAPTVIEVCGDDTVLQYQAYKRVWPATQRDSLFWSHMRRLDSTQFPVDEAVTSAGLVVLDTWMVVNYSTKYGEERLPASAKTPSFIRLQVDVELFCQTLWHPPTPDFDISTLPDSAQLQCLSPEEQRAQWEAVGVKREALQCRLLYASQINPGGWAPAAVVRTMARREYPHFLRRISEFVVGHTMEKTPKF
ncbi:collagen type iv alpha 3 binding protein [Echinococcus multilocularis]|uniref:Collagen type iv alpha 3 binding protein n=1 Tax=Echinococcus multilocularis TaxID=6211 RepID=A0A068XZU3_ECHMU|nr:collagen type iv alpha 3 binding protein [Echinococcus multilocularis]